MTTITYHIPSINCGHCVHTIQTEVGDLPGVESVEASADSKNATFTFSDPASEEAIKSLLVEINFPAAD